MKLFFCERQALPLPEYHRFPASKYSLLLDRLNENGLAHQYVLIPSVPTSDEHLLTVHTSDYLDRMVGGRMTEKEMRRIGFPWSAALVDRSRRSVGGTIAACRTALVEGSAANLGGGTHHAYLDHGEGYCVFNDVAVAARVLHNEKRLERIIILDCDVHQGNGTAAIFSNDPGVFTFSIHGSKNFPFHKHAGDLDIALSDGCDDATYLDSLESGVRDSIARINAELAIYIAGADPFIGDRLGRLAMTKGGLAERDRLIFSHCSRQRIPVAVVMGGGYAREVRDIVDINMQTLLIAAEFRLQFLSRIDS
ncbi:MAG: deacetylase [Chloroflexi bacterium RBG_16_54_18]|nr:MAG: deacetylase [Chloroflexi bacterium RBG_16_54_18]